MLFDLIYAIPFPDWIKPDIFKIGNFGVKWYGVAYVVGVFLAFYYAVKTTEKKPIWQITDISRGPELIPNRHMLEDFMFFCLLGIILGGRIGSILLYDTAQYLENPLRIFMIWKGGMAFHGGFLGVCVAVWYMARSRKMEIWRIADMAAIGAPIGIGLVRITNFINQELYGRATDLPWGFVFNTDATSQPRHPSQLYEAALEGLVIFLLLRIATHKYKTLTRPGITAGLFIFLYGLFRILVENVREPDPIAQFGFLTRGMAYSLPMLIIGGAILYWASRRPPVSPKYPKDDSA